MSLFLFLLFATIALLYLGPRTRGVPIGIVQMATVLGRFIGGVPDWRGLRREWRRLWPLLLLGHLAAPACTPAKWSPAPAAPRAAPADAGAAPTPAPAPAAAVALDLAKCAAMGAAQPMSTFLGRFIAEDPEWRVQLRGALLGGLGGAVVCGLELLASAVPSDAPASSSAPETVGSRIWRLAAACPDGACPDARRRAAWLLVDLDKQGLVKLPPSGER